jgi:hypothetical protein
MAAQLGCATAGDGDESSVLQRYRGQCGFQGKWSNTVIHPYFLKLLLQRYRGQRGFQGK